MASLNDIVLVCKLLENEPNTTNVLFQIFGDESCSFSSDENDLLLMFYSLEKVEEYVYEKLQTEAPLVDFSLLEAANHADTLISGHTLSNLDLQAIKTWTNLIKNTNPKAFMNGVRDLVREQMIKEGWWEPGEDYRERYLSLLQATYMAANAVLASEKKPFMGGIDWNETRKMAVNEIRRINGED